MEKLEAQLTVIQQLLSAFVFPDKTSIPIEDLISISVPKQSSSAASTRHVTPILDAASPSLNSDVIPNEEFTYKSITINYAKRLIDSTSCNRKNSDKNVNKWRAHSVTFYNNDKLIIKEWFQTLLKVLSGKENYFDEFASTQNGVVDSF